VDEPTALLRDGTGSAPPRSDASHPSIAPYGPHRAGDGHDVLFGIQNEREWTRFCADVLHDATIATDARFATNPNRVANRPALTQTIESAFSSNTAAQVTDALDRAGIANGRVNDVGEIRNHEQLGARDRWRSVDSSAGPIDAALPPANLDGVESFMGAIPEAGAHTDALLRELGFSSERVAALREAGAI